MSSQRAAQLVEAGVWLRLSGDHEGARRLFEQALKLDPGNVRARQLLEARAAPTAPKPPAPLPPPEPVTNPFSPSPPTAGNPMEGDWGLATGFDSMIIAPAPGAQPPAQQPGPPAPSERRPMPPLPGAQLPFELDAPPSRLPLEDSSSFGTLQGAPNPLTPSSTLLFGEHAAGPAAGNTLVFSSAGQLPPTRAGSESSTLVFGAAPPPVASALPFEAEVPTGAPESTTMVFGAHSAGGLFEMPASSTQIFSAGPRAPAQPFLGAPETSTMVFSGFQSPGADVPGAPEASTLVFGQNLRPPAVAPVGPSPAPFAIPPESAQGLGVASSSTMVFGGGDPAAFPPRIAPAGQAGPASIRHTLEGPAFSAPIEPLGLGEGPEPSTLVFGSLPRAAFEMPAPRPTVPEPAPLGAQVAARASAFELEPAASPVPPPSAPPLAVGATSAWDARSNPGIALSSGPEVKQSSAFALFTPEPPPPRTPKQQKEEIQTLLRGARDLLALDDHSGAMDLISRAQELAPNDPDVATLRERSEGTLQTIFESKLGDLSRTPRVKLKDDEVIWLNLDHRAGFVLAQIDGSVTFEDVFSVSGMSRLDTARILAQLVEEGVISRG